MKQRDSTLIRCIAARTNGHSQRTTHDRIDAFRRQRLVRNHWKSVRMKIGLTYGHVASNLGDLAINRGMMNLLRGLPSPPRVQVVLLNPNDAYIDGARASFGSELNPTFSTLRTRPERLRERLGGEEEMSRLMGYLFEPDSFLKDCGLSDCDALLFHPGEHLFANPGDDRTDLFWRLLPALAAAKAGIPFIVPPITAGPFHDQHTNRLIRTFLSLCNAVAVREPRSAELIAPLLGEVPPPLLDPAFFLDPPACNEEALRQPRMGIIMRLDAVGLRVGGAQSGKNYREFAADGFRTNRAFCAALTAAQTFLDERPDGAIDLIVQSKYDLELATEVASELTDMGMGDRVRLVQPETIDSYLGTLSRLTCVVSSRFHGCIFSFVSGVPAFGCRFEQHGHKLAGLYELVGLPDQYLNLSEKSSAELEAMLRQFLRSDTSHQVPDPDRVAALREQTREWLGASIQQSRPEFSHADLLAASIEYLRQINHARHNAVTSYIREIQKPHNGQEQRLARELKELREASVNVADEFTTMHRRTIKRHCTVTGSTKYRLGKFLLEHAQSPWLILLFPLRFAAWTLLEIRHRHRRRTSPQKEFAKPMLQGEKACAQIYQRYFDRAMLAEIEQRRKDAPDEMPIPLGSDTSWASRVMTLCESVVQRAVTRGVPRPFAMPGIWAARLLLGHEVTAKLIQEASAGAGDLRTKERVFAYMTRISSASMQSVWNRRWQAVASQLRLLESGYSCPDRPAPDRLRIDCEQARNRTLMYLHNSMPFFSGGYATRSHGVLSAVRSAGYEPMAVTRLGFPWDLPGRPDDPAPGDLTVPEIIDEIPYFRLPPNGNGRYDIPIEDYLDASADALEAFLRKRAASLIHSASFASTCGLPAMKAARRLGLPFVYEVRGLAYLTKLSRQPAWEGSDEYELDVRLERQAADGADVVLTLTQAMKDELVRIGVDGSKIRVFPNCVNADRFQPQPRNKALARKLGVENSVVIGYIGGFVDYEGLDTLIRAFAKLLTVTSKSLKLLLVGDGSEFNRLQGLVRELGIEDHVLFTGRLPHSVVADYYSLVDVAPFPRVSIPVCEVVSPMKPFEAMAMEKTVVVSSVRALAEIIQDSTTGLVFEKGSLDSFVEVLRTAVSDGNHRRKMGQAARQWVLKHRTWDLIAKEIEEVYGSLIPAGERIPALRA
jgi:glycosyltransferase involved in cell wall biosynthesis/polysaccharide pyruvyl transferase WcaK-like protein